MIHEGKFHYADEKTRLRSNRKWLWAMPFLMTVLTGCAPAVVMFHPDGPVSRVEMRLIITSMILIAIIVMPVLVLVWYIVYRYRDRPGNTAPYDPEWAESGTLEVIWWVVPIIIIGILGTFTVRDTYALTRPPEPTARPLTIEVTSLDWKWVFQYPQQKISTVNYCEIPANQPVQFVLTADSPLNSFWVPELGGQEYAMPGMAMRLWLQADHPGTYQGRSANFSGKGFAHMSFDVVAANKTSFDAWVSNVKKTAPVLTKNGYQELRKPSVVGRKTYSSYPLDIFQNTIMSEGGMMSMRHDKTVLHSLY